MVKMSIKGMILLFILISLFQFRAHALTNATSSHFTTSEQLLSMGNIGLFEPIHQYSWSEWLTLNDGKQNGIQFSFRKGDNNFIERGMVFLRFYNRYRSPVNGNIVFNIINNASGAQSESQNEGFTMEAESLQEEEGSWFIVPGDNDDPNVWGRTSVGLRNIRVTRLSFTKY